MTFKQPLFYRSIVDTCKTKPRRGVGGLVFTICTMLSDNNKRNTYHREEEALTLYLCCVLQSVRGGSFALQSMYPDLFDQLLTCATFGVHAPTYGAIQAKSFGSVKGPQVQQTLITSSSLTTSTVSWPYQKTSSTTNSN